MMVAVQQRGAVVMSKTYLPYGPDQQWLPDDHLAHFISGVVDQVDLSDITARHEREMRGGPPYHPRTTA